MHIRFDALVVDRIQFVYFWVAVNGYKLKKTCDWFNILLKNLQSLFFFFIKIKFYQK
jgi:hypothetical protein